MNRYDQDKKQLEEHKKNPMANYSDTVNRTMIGDLGALTNGGCLTRIITLIIIIGGIFLLSQCSI